MQTRKEAIRRAILDSARKRFLQNGYLGTTMRDIAADAQCSLGNLYTYFSDKDDLLVELVKPTLTAIRRALTAAGVPDDRTDSACPARTLADSSEILAAFIDDRREELTLLLLRHEGSSLAQVPESLAQELTEFLTSRMHTLPAPFVEAASRSSFFLHCYATFLVSCLVEALKHEVPVKSLPELIRSIARLAG
jgi:AcrR family transcriptional regulator